MAIQQTLAQKRSKAAWDYAIQAKSALEGKKYKEYVNLVKKLPAMVATNGLGQTLAFLLAKAGGKEGMLRAEQKKSADGLLYCQLQDWLTTGDSKLYPYRSPYSVKADNEEDWKKVIDRINAKDSTHYRWATVEALNLLPWLKSYADALQEGEKDRQEVEKNKRGFSGGAHESSESTE